MLDTEIGTLVAGQARRGDSSCRVAARSRSPSTFRTVSRSGTDTLPPLSVAAHRGTIIAQCRLVLRARSHAATLSAEAASTGALPEIAKSTVGRLLTGPIACSVSTPMSAGNESQTGRTREAVRFRVLHARRSSQVRIAAGPAGKPTTDRKFGSEPNSALSRIGRGRKFRDKAECLRRRSAGEDRSLFPKALDLPPAPWTTRSVDATA